MSQLSSGPLGPVWPVDLPDTVVDAGELIRHRPRERYGKRSYWTRCRRVAIDFPKGVSPQTSWVEDCPECFPRYVAGTGGG
jgi:hypothetical protein